MLEPGRLPPPRLVPAEFIRNASPEEHLSTTRGSRLLCRRTDRVSGRGPHPPAAIAAEMPHMSLHMPRHAGSSAHWPQPKSTRNSSAVPLWRDLASLRLRSTDRSARRCGTDRSRRRRCRAGRWLGTNRAKAGRSAPARRDQQHRSRRARLAQMPETRPRPANLRPMLRFCSVAWAAM